MVLSLFSFMVLSLSSFMIILWDESIVVVSMFVMMM